MPSSPLDPPLQGVLLVGSVYVKRLFTSLHTTMDRARRNVFAAPACGSDAHTAHPSCTYKWLGWAMRGLQSPGPAPSASTSLPSPRAALSADTTTSRLSLEPVRTYDLVTSIYPVRYTLKGTIYLNSTTL